MSTSYRWSTLTTADTAAWAELVNHLAVVDGTEEFYSAEDLAEELEDPHLDPAQDTVAVWADSESGTEELVAFGVARLRQSLDHEGRAGVPLEGGVHIEHRGRGIGTQLMQKLEARGAQKATDRYPGVQYYFATGGGLEESSARIFHLARGYQVARYFNLMSRPLSWNPPDSPDSAAASTGGRQLPEGVTVRAPEQGDEKAVFEAHAAAFVDHWGSAPPSPSVWHETWTSRSNRAAVSRIAVDASGTVLAYALCGQWVERELYVNLVGTVPAARGNGLGSAVLAHTIEAAASSGDYDVIELDVDSESLTGATRLYERLGFAVKHTSAAMRHYQQPADKH